LTEKLEDRKIEGMLRAILGGRSEAAMSKTFLRSDAASFVFFVLFCGNS
jgi:hypothetical protein